MPPIARRPIFALKQPSFPLALLLATAFLFAGCRGLRPDAPSQTNVEPRITQTGTNIPLPAKPAEPTTTAAEREAAKRAARAKPKRETPASTPAEEEDIVIRGGFR